MDAPETEASIKPFEPNYWCFISYRHADNKVEDRQWASWLHQEIERYEVPAELVGTMNRRGQTIPARIYPVFRDEESLPADSQIGTSIATALERSNFLVVLCSPTAVESLYVKQEILYFQQINRGDRIIPAIVVGNPGDPRTECFPEPLRRSFGADEKLTPGGPLAADFRLSDGREGFTSAEAYRVTLARAGNFKKRQIKSLVHDYEFRLQRAKLKVIAGILGVDLETLTKRDKAYQLEIARRKSRIQRRLAVIFAALFILASLAAWNAIKGRNRALIGQSLQLASQARGLAPSNHDLAKKIALTALPTRKAINERPFVKDAELALFGASVSSPHGRPFDHGEEITQYFITPDGTRIILAGESISLWDASSGELVSRYRPSRGFNQAVALSTSGEFIFFAEMTPFGRGWYVGKNEVKPTVASLFIARTRDGEIVSMSQLQDMRVDIAYASDDTLCLYSKDSAYWYSLKSSHDKVTPALERKVDFGGRFEAKQRFIFSRRNLACDQKNGRLFVQEEKEGGRVWRVSRRDGPVAPLPIENDFIKSVSLSPDGSRVAVSTNSRGLRLFDAETLVEHKARPDQPLPTDIVTMAFSTERPLIHVVSKTRRLQDYTYSLELLPTASPPITDETSIMGFNDGWFVATDKKENPHIGSLEKSLIFPLPPFSADVAPKVLRVGGVYWALYTSSDRIGRFINLENPTTRMISSARPAQSVSAVAFCPARKVAYVGSPIGVLTAEDAQTGRVLWSRQIHEKSAILNISPDKQGDMVVISFADGSVVVASNEGTWLGGGKFEFGEVNLSRINKSGDSVNLLSMQNNMPCVSWSLDERRQRWEWDRKREYTAQFAMRVHSIGCKAEFLPETNPTHILVSIFGDGMAGADPPVLLFG